MLSPYQILDLSDEKGLLCGKLLGDLGADVIKVERPGGDSARNIGPFYHDQVDPNKSLFWWAFNTSKRGITLDIETTDGQGMLKKLVKSADFIIESFPPGYMDKLGLGYSALEKINPGIIMVSITPFGQTGPYKDYKASDIVAWAMGGQMYPWGDLDRPPIHISHHSQAYLHAGAEAAVGALMALHYREMTGEGQHVDVSIQESVVQANSGVTAIWDMMKVNQKRGTGLRQIYPNVRTTLLWHCKDGYVIWIYWFGLQATWNLPLIKWMESEGMADDFLREFNWEEFKVETTSQEIIDHLEERTARFFLTHTKAELLLGALEYGAHLFPVNTTKDILESTQLIARRFWAKLKHPEIDITITYPGPFACTSEMPLRISHRAPLIGEHNNDILEKLHISTQEAMPSKEVQSHIARLNTTNSRGNLEIDFLRGVKIADFSWVITGPITTKHFSDYGATVVKIESRSRLDPARTTSNFKDGIAGVNRSGLFNQWSTGKLSLTLNLAHTKGVEIVKRLVSWADVVVENFAGGAMENMGLGYEELKKVKPEIIMLSTCMQGQTGPFARQPGTGHQLTALSGFNHIAGWPDREPPFLGSYTDFIAPRLNALAILSALDYRRRTGKGQYLDMSQYETGMHFMSPPILDYLVNQRIANRMGNRSGYAAPHGAYRCRGEDRWCAIAVFTDDEWKSLCGTLGKPAWTKDPKFATLQVRKENEDELDRLVEEWTINHTAENIMAMMQEAGVGAGVLETGEDLLEHDPQLKYRHFFSHLDHPEVGKHYVPGSSFTLSKCPCELRRAPLLGEHTEYVLKEILAMSDEEIAELVVEEIVT